MSITRLLEDPVPNHTAIDAPGLIITGANMSGKSTFLRTISLSALTAQTFGFCFARSFTTARFRIVTLIQKRDTVSGGSSYYFYEARRIFEMVEGTRESDPLLFIVDEFFSGTNSRERIAAAVAVLRFLSNRRCIAVAATHDLDIANILADTFDLRYFADTMSDDSIRFDYVLRPGVIRSTNGIKLLRAIGYPEEIVADAESMGNPPSTGSNRQD